MIRNDALARLLERADRRTFLKAAGALGVGAVAGGALSLFKVIDRGLDDNAFSRTRTAMGTFVEVTAVHESRDHAEGAVEAAFAEMDRLIAILSRHDESTPLSDLNAHGRLADPPRALTDVVLHALDVHRRTGGAFDPTVKPLIDLLEASGKKVPGAAEIRDAVALVGADGVRFSDRRIDFVRGQMGLTLDGVAKGYIVDRMSDRLASAGVANHLVNAGGDIRTRGERSPGRPWTIAIEDPHKKGDYPDVIRMRDGAIATSGSYENFYDDDRTRHHIVHPSTGGSPLETVSVSVRARSVMDADALSTAVMLSPAQAGSWTTSRDRDFAFFLVRNDGGLRRSPNWPG